MIPVDSPLARPAVIPAATTAAELADLARLRVGARLEALLTERLAGGTVALRLRLPERPGQWSAPVGARLDPAPPLSGTPDTPPPTARAAPTPGPPPPAPAPTPARLLVEIVAVRPALVVRLLDPVTARPAAAHPPADPEAAAHEWMNTQVRQHLPLARPLAPALSLLDRVVREQTGGVTPERQAVSVVLERLANTRDLVEPARLPVVIRQSGLWLEAGLARAAGQLARGSAPESDPASDFTSDLKAQLLRLAEQLRLQAQSTRPPIRHEPRSDSGQPPRPAPAPPEPGAPTSRPAPPAPEPGAPTPRSVPPAPESSQPPRPAPPAPESGAPTPRPAPPAPESSQPPRPAPAPPDPGSPPRPAPPAPEPGAPTRPVPPPAVEPDTTRQTLSETAPPTGRPQSLTQEVDGMIRHIVTRQLQTLDANTEQTRWLLELPFRTPGGILALDADIAREPAADPAREAGWSIRLRLDLPRLGPLRITLTLHGTRLHAALRTASPAGADLLRGHLDELHARLTARDLDVASLHAGVQAGLATAADTARPTAHQDAPLVRERA